MPLGRILSPQAKQEVYRDGCKAHRVKGQAAIDQIPALRKQEAQGIQQKSRHTVSHIHPAAAAQNKVPEGGSGEFADQEYRPPEAGRKAQHGTKITWQISIGMPSGKCSSWHTPSATPDRRIPPAIASMPIASQRTGGQPLGGQVFLSFTTCWEVPLTCFCSFSTENTSFQKWIAAFRHCTVSGFESR